MPKKNPSVLRTDLRNHAAVRAWNELRSESGEPERITILKQKTRSPVCLLEGLGTGGSNIVAKRAVRAKAIAEHRVYEEYLPQLPVSSVHYYGSIEEDGGEYYWLFVAPAAGEEYSPLLHDHRKLAAEWLARLHTSALRLSTPTGLPARGPEHYFTRLLSAHDRVLRGRANPALSPEDLDTLERVSAQCDVLTSRWTEVERLCVGVPQTLIHGDFARKNMRVHDTPLRRILRVFDWGTAGWGVPAADLAQASSLKDCYWVSPDLETYHSSVRECWPHLSLEALESLATAGKMFRAIVCLDGDAKSLETSWVEGAMENIRRYRGHLDEAFQVAGFGAASGHSPAPASPTDSTPLLEHPAVRAWNGLQSSRVVPARVTTLRDRRGTRVYCLEGLGSENGIVAKHTSLDAATQERTIYEQVIPHLPLTALRYHGFAPDEDEERGWIFLECADGFGYSPSAKEHRVLAARWLGCLHTAGAHVPSSLRLPSRGPDHYLGHLQSARRKIVHDFGNPVLTSDQRSTLRGTLSQLDDVEMQWSRVNALCARVPRTLIHGDFAPKNIRVRNGRSGMELQVFDWEHAGWGTPAADLVQWRDRFEKDWASPDLELYGSVMRETWPDLDLDVIQPLADVGKMFRLLTWIDGDVKNLETKWVEPAVGNLQIYRTHLADAVTRLA